MAEAIESATCSEAKRSYSWWWDSHITPKNSKWLQENLTSMDNKIKSMIKLIEEDADSFARRAEMYYKKRPELMKLVEEFYRAYRALAERYDHVIGALRQAHRAIAVAFPNQIQSMLPDEPPSDSVEEENGDFPEENIPFMSREEWKHLNCLLVDEEAHKRFSEGLLMKGLNLTEDAGKNSELKKLQDEVFKLSIENKNLKNLIESESMRADKSETESQGLKDAVLKLKSQLEAEISRREDEVHRLNDEMSLKVTELNIAEERCLDLEEENRSLRFNGAESCGLRDAISKLNSELRNSLLQNKISQERISDLEAELCRSGDQLQKLNAEISIRSSKLNIAEEQYLVLQEENKSFQSMVNRFKMIAAKKDEEFTMREEELCKLKQLIEDERRRRMIAEVANQSLRKLCSQSEETIKLLGSEIRSGAELLRSKTGLEEEIKRLHEENNELSERSLSSLSKIVGLQDEINSLRRSKLEIAEDLRLMESLSERNCRFKNSLSDVTAELEWLREKIKGLEECCESLRRNASSHESQNTVLVSHVDDVRKKMKKLSDKSTLFENSLCDIIFEFEGLRGKVKAMEESYKSTYNQNCDLIAENNNLVAQVEKIEQHMESLENRFSAFEEGKHVNMDIDRFIMKQILYDINEKNLFLSDKCGKYMDKLRCAEELTLELEHDQLVQEKKVALLVEHNKKLSEWIHAFVREFDAKGDIESSNFGYKDIEEFHSIHFEKSPFNVLMEQLGLSLVELRAQKNVLEQESEKKNEEISLLRSDSYELMEVNELLRKDLNASNLQKEVLKIELEKMHRKLSDFEKMPFLAESECVSSNSFELREQADSQEEEHEAILEEFMINESLSCNFRSSDAENSSGIDQLINDVHNLHGITNGLGQDIRVINQHLRDLAFDFETRKSALIEDDINKSRKNQLEQRIMEWSDTNPRFRNLQIKNKEGLMVEELEKKILHLSKENVYRDDENEFLRRTNEKFVGEISRLHKEAEALRRSEKNSASQIRRAKDQIRILREESASYLLDINAASIIQLVFKQSVVELMLKVQSFEAGDCKQSEITIGEISPRRVRREDFMKKNDAFERKQGNNSFAPLQQKRICQVRDKDHAPKASAGIMELKMLHGKVKQLQKTVTNAERLLAQEEIAGDSNFASGTTKIKARRSKRSGIALQLEAEKKKYAIFRTGDEFCSETDEQSREMLGPATDNVSENQEISTMVDETLSSDALRLFHLQENLEELKKSFEVSETSRHWSSSSSNAINEQLKISEGVIQQLIDINIKLTEMAGSSSASLDDSEGRRRVAERAQMASEKIDAVEVELENTQCMFSKLLEEEESGAPKALQRKSRFPLKSFMYWRRNDSRQKKRLFCACMRLNNRGD